MLHYYIVVTEICFVNSFIFLLCVCLGKINIYRHERTVFLNYFTHAVFICKLQAFFIKEKSDFCSRLCLISICHLVFCTTITGPVNRCGTLFIRKSINMNFVRNHKSGIETKSEMTNHLIIGCLIFILLKKLCCTGKCNLSNIFLYFVCRHTDTVINKLQSLLIRIHNNIHCRFISVRKCVITHNFQFSQLGDCITSIGDHLSYKNIMV